MQRLESKHINYRELFNVNVDEYHGTCDQIGISEDGLLLYIETEESHIGGTCFVSHVYYAIEKEEYRYYYDIAYENGGIEEALDLGYSSQDELDDLYD